MTSQKLKASPQVWTLARDLGIKRTEDAVDAIVAFCRRKALQSLAPLEIRRLQDCPDLATLLDCVTSLVGTTFREVHSDDELRELRTESLQRGETGFATIEAELTDDVFAISYRRINRKPHEGPYVSVIDCRGEKGPRLYFSKWHELAHLLTVTDQMRLRFTRTHSRLNTDNAEEALMDVIAGDLGFAGEVVRAHASGPVSFDGLELLRSRLCPEASWQASVRGFISAWPAPALYVIAAPGLKADEQRSLDQLGFGFTEPPTPQLRVQQIAFNEVGRAAGLYIPRNMRVPEDSVIRFACEMRTPVASTAEDLAWWGTSDGKHLEPFPVQVEARPYLEGVHAIIVPF
jgi:hypothetical protein